MKKLLLLITTVGLVMAAISCSDEDEPKRGNGVFTVNPLMINHMYNTLTNELIGLKTTHNKLTFDTVNHTASLELNYNDGSDKTLTLNDIKATFKRLGAYGVYVLKSPSDDRFSGYVDISQGSMRYRYTTADGIRVISFLPEIYFLRTKNTVTYDDTTKATTMESTMYHFNINTASGDAMVQVMDIVHAKDLKRFNNLTAMSIPYTVTAKGFTFQAQNVSTTGSYTAWVDSTGSNTKTTDQYPFKTFNATVNMADDPVNDLLDATYMMGGSATVVATGSTYPIVTTN